MTDPTPEQVEAARAEYDRSEDMCAALVAAAGVTPPVTSTITEDQLTTLELTAGSHGMRNALEAVGVAVVESFRNPYELEVDEAKLAEAIAEELETDDAIAEDWSNGKLNATARRLVEFAVLPVLRGGGQ